MDVKRVLVLAALLVPARGWVQRRATGCSAPSSLAAHALSLTAQWSHPAELRPPRPTLAEALVACADSDDDTCSVEMVEIVAAAKAQVAAVADALSACADPAATECSVELMDDVIAPWQAVVASATAALTACDEPGADECSLEAMEVVSAAKARRQEMNNVKMFKLWQHYGV